jgi:hypothetical protein
MKHNHIRKIAARICRTLSRKASDHPQDGPGRDVRPLRRTDDLQRRAAGGGERAAAMPLNRAARANRDHVSLANWREIIAPDLTSEPPDLALNGLGSPSDQQEALELNVVDCAIEALVAPHLWN